MSQSLSKSMYIFYEIVSFMEYKEKLQLQLISKKFYENIVPRNMESSSVRSAEHNKKQDCLYHYASGYYFYRSLDSIVSDLKTDPANRAGISREMSLLSSGPPAPHWHYMVPENQDYVVKHGLNKNLKFGRTLYIPG